MTTTLRLHISGVCSPILGTPSDGLAYCPDPPQFIGLDESASTPLGFDEAWNRLASLMDRNAVGLEDLERFTADPTVLDGLREAASRAILEAVETGTPARRRRIFSRAARSWRLREFTIPDMIDEDADLHLTIAVRSYLKTADAARLTQLVRRASQRRTPG